MREVVGRVLCAASALGLVAGAIVHARAFPGTLPHVDSSSLTPFLAGCFKALWLGDSAYLLGLAAIQALLALRPSDASPTLYVLLGAIPLGIALIMVAFLGAAFPPAWLLVTCGLATVAAAFCRKPGTVERNAVASRRAA
jgi:hypothetical protein